METFIIKLTVAVAPLLTMISIIVLAEARRHKTAIARLSRLRAHIADNRDTAHLRSR